MSTLAKMLAGGKRDSAVWGWLEHDYSKKLFTLIFNFMDDN
jgi:hypothetical protein